MSPLISGSTIEVGRGGRAGRTLGVAVLAGMLTGGAVVVGGGSSAGTTPGDRSSAVASTAAPAGSDPVTRPATDPEPVSEGSATPAPTTSAVPTAPPTTTTTTSTTTTGVPNASALPAGTTRYVADAPARLLDTRTADGAPPPEVVDLDVAVDRATAAYALSVTVMESRRGGSVAVDAGRGAITAVDLPAADLTTTNLVLVPAIAGETVAVTNTTGGQVVVDLVGRFEPSTGSTSGRFVSSPPRRLIHHETAIDGRQGVVEVPDAVDVGEPIDAVLALVSADVGASGGAVRLGPATDQYDQMLMWGPGDDATEGGADRRGVVLIQPGDDGTFAFRYDGGSVLDVDVVGYFTNDDAEWDTAGLFVPADDPETFSGTFEAGPAELGALPSWAGAAFVTLTASGTAPTSDPLDLAVARGRTVGTVLRAGDAEPDGSGTRPLDVFSSGPLEARVQVLGAFVEH